jgi:hypothetical protein
MNSPVTHTRGKHRAESRDGGGELELNSAPPLENQDSIQQLFETVEALFLGTLEGEEKAKAEELVKRHPDASAYLKELESDSSDDVAFEQMRTELGIRLPWLLSPQPVPHSAMAQAMAALYGPPAAKFDLEEKTVKQQKPSALGTAVAKTPHSQTAVAASLDQIHLPPRPSPNEGRKG